MYARNTLEQLLAAYTNSESQNAQRHRQTDRQTDNRMMPIADHTVWQYDRLKIIYKAHMVQKSNLSLLAHKHV